MEAWEKKVERMENNPRRKAKESRTREYYERQFPEIRKQREQQERFQRYRALYPSLVSIILLLMHYKTLYAFWCWSLASHTCSNVNTFPTLMGFAVFASVDRSAWQLPRFRSEERKGAIFITFAKEVMFLPVCLLAKLLRFKNGF